MDSEMTELRHQILSLHQRLFECDAEKREIVRLILAIFRF
jgi:hypothetical protein